MANVPKFEVAYGLLTDVCKAHGISKTKAFQLAGDGMLDTFLFGNRRYVYIESVHSLPERLKLLEERSGPEVEK